MDSIYLIKELSYLLKVLNVKVDRGLLTKELLSDPCYPSLASVSKTLTFFGIDNEPYIVDKNHLSSLKNVIVHTIEENGHFYVLKECNDDYVRLYDGIDKTISKLEFLSVWDGITLKTNVAHLNYYPSYNYTASIALTASLLLVISGIYVLQGRMIVDLILDVIGLIFAGCLLKKQFYNYATVPLCKMGSKFDCEYVSGENPFRRWIPFDLPIMGLFFFIYSITYLILVKQIDYIFLAVNVAAFTFMLILTCYQLFVIRKYCVYCLGIAIIVLMKLFLMKLSSGTTSLSIIPLLACAFSFTFLLSMLIYKLTCVVSNLKEKEIALLRFKRDKGVMLESFSKKHIKLPINGMMEFGNKNANIVVTTFISLRCSHCREVVKDIIKLIKHFPNRFLWRVAIEGAYHPAMPENVFAKINARQLNLLRLYNQDKNQCMYALRSWSIMRKKTNDAGITASYRHQLEIVKKENINHYPYIWVNDYILPEDYTIKDLQYIQNEIIQLG